VSSPSFATVASTVVVPPAATVAGFEYTDAIARCTPGSATAALGAAASSSAAHPVSTVLPNLTRDNTITHLPS